MEEVKCPQCGWIGLGTTTYKDMRFRGYVHQYVCSACYNTFEQAEQDGIPTTCPECGATPKKFKHWRIASGCPKCGHQLELTGVHYFMD